MIHHLHMKAVLSIFALLFFNNGYSETYQSYNYPNRYGQQFNNQQSHTSSPQSLLNHARQLKSSVLNAEKTGSSQFSTLIRDLKKTLKDR